MAHDYQRLMDQVKAAIESQTNVERIPEVAPSYAEACDEINSKLAYCLTYLRAGNYSEALRAEGEYSPSLLENCSIIQQIDYDDWVDICIQLNIVMPERINQETIEWLKNVKCTHPAAEKILRDDFRRLCTLRAPVKERLQILRKLCVIEPEHELWRRMISNYEEPAIEEYAEEFNFLKSDFKNANKIVAMQKELTSSSWSVKAASNLIKQVNQWCQKGTWFWNMNQLGKKFDALRILKANPQFNLENEEDFDKAQNIKFEIIDILNRCQTNVYSLAPDLKNSYQELIDEWIADEENNRLLQQTYEEKKQKLYDVFDFCEANNNMFTKHNELLEHLNYCFDTFSNWISDQNLGMEQYIYDDYCRTRNYLKNKIKSKAMIIGISIGIFTVGLGIIIVVLAK